MDEFDDVNDGKRPNDQNLNDSSHFSDFLHIFKHVTLRLIGPQLDDQKEH